MSPAAGNCIPESKRVQRVQGTIGAPAPQCPRFGPGTASPSGLFEGLRPRELYSTLCAYSAWNTQVGRSWPLACPIGGLPFNRPTDWRGERQRRHFNAAFGGIYAHRSEGAIPQPSAPEALSNLRTFRPKGLSILRTFCTTLLHNPFIQPSADRRPQPAAQPPPQPSAARGGCQTSEPSGP